MSGKVIQLFGTYLASAHPNFSHRFHQESGLFQDALPLVETNTAVEGLIQLHSLQMESSLLHISSSPGTLATRDLGSRVSIDVTLTSELGFC
jgi:hypothetical protein